MKRFINNILFFSAIMILFGATIEYFLRQIPTDYNYKANFYQKNAQSIKIWTLGSSHTYYGIRPTYFSDTSFNGAHVSQSIKFDYYIFDKYINQMDSLKVLIMPISYFTLFSNLETGIEKWRVVNYTSYNIYLPKIKTSLKLLNESNPLNKAIKSILGQENDRYCNDLGFGTKYSFENRKTDLNSSAEAAIKRHTNKNININVLKQNKEYLKKICKICNKKQIQVIILTPPAHKSYYNLLDANQLKITTTTCYDIANQYDNVVYLNWLEDKRFTEDDFYDADHLNDRGAIKLTKFLDEYIR
jgi:hypothetical protein